MSEDYSKVRMNSGLTLWSYRWLQIESYVCGPGRGEIVQSITALDLKMQGLKFSL